MSGESQYSEVAWVGVGFRGVKTGETVYIQRKHGLGVGGFQGCKEEQNGIYSTSLAWGWMGFRGVKVKNGETVYMSSCIKYVQ